VPSSSIGSSQHVVLGHEIRIDVIVGQCAIFVGPGDPVDPELALPVIVPKRAPQSSGLDEHLEADAALEFLVVGGVDVADHSVGDVRVDVERSSAGRPIARGLPTVDGSPRKCGAAQAEQTGPFARGSQRGVPPAQR
jgi:hypothetical protein